LAVACVSLSGWLFLSACAGDDDGSGGTGGGAGTGGSTGGSAGSAAGTGSASGGSAGSTGGVSSGGSAGGGGSGGKGGVPGAPPVDPTKDVGELTDAEKGALCDWSVQILGGYGHETDCGNNIFVRTHASQAVCLLIEFPADCGLTVLEWELCADARVETNGCDFPPECEVVRDC
jgi:hypothetical protein